jgi:hypothetical protein
LSLPIPEADPAEVYGVFRNQRAFPEYRPEGGDLWIGDDGSVVARRRETIPDELVEAELLRTPDLDDAVGRPRWLTSHTAAATSSAAIGWNRTWGNRTTSPSVASSAIRFTNSKNCVARTTVYGIEAPSISPSWVTFARR